MTSLQASVTQNGDYLMFDNSHYLKTRVETVSTFYIASSFYISKITRSLYVAQAFEELYLGKSHKTGLKYLLNQSSELTLAMHVQ